MAVYFIRAKTGGPVKIGTARDARERLRQLQGAHHEELAIIRQIPGGQAVEAWFHLKFATHRIRGEWFRFAPEMLTLDYHLPAAPDRRPLTGLHWIPPGLDFDYVWRTGDLSGCVLAAASTADASQAPAPAVEAGE